MGYRDKVLQQVGSDHPINKGVKMQAHHLISRKALLDSSIENRLEDFKYDIDNVDNIALIPCTLQGACHLNVQLHRGNHPGVLSVDNGNNDDDSEHPESYHKDIKKRINKLKDDIEDGDYCKKESYKKLLRKLDRLSNQIAVDINNHDLALTNISENFGSGSKNNGKGCCDADYVKDARASKSACSSERDHYNKQAKGQRKEDIKYKKPDSYVIRGGN
jgi:hypothetical protein